MIRIIKMKIKLNRLFLSSGTTKALQKMVTWMKHSAKKLLKDLLATCKADTAMSDEAFK